MYLKSLELVGFKSFAQRTVLEFHRGVTAVVGPNGCGKSNVLDAMRWVLGEQSAKALRGGEMADVIFSGTDSRQALGMGEVTLTFAECEKELGVDWNEVSITRRIFRDGQSEYFMNKTPCRLRDIHQLFMDTGIGRSAYSIMEQGKIDQILSSRPEDRRAIFEEAAGITKFKSQKKEALRKMEATEANLIRANDIIREVKRQIGSLQRQAAKARRYQALITDVRTLDTHHSKYQLDQLAQAQEHAVSEIDRLNKAHEAQAVQIEEAESVLAGRRHDLDAMEQRLSAARQAVQDLRNQIGNAEHRLAFNAERTREFSSLTGRYNADIAAAEEKLRVQETQIHDTDLELEQIAQTLQFEETHLAEKKEATSQMTASRMEMEREVQQAFGNIARTENALASQRADLASTTTLRDNAATRMAALDDELRDSQATVERLTAQRDETRAQVEHSHLALAEHQEQLALVDQAVRSLEGELAAAERAVSEQQRKLAERESKLEVLRQLNEEGQGLDKGTQAVLRGLDNPEFFKPAIAGALTQFIDVEERFITAIEAALGASLQMLVMKDMMVAESVIKTLSAKKLGRASLALREFAPEAGATPSAELPAGALGWAIDFAKAAPEVAPLLSRLLHNVAVVENVEAALALGRTQASLVTLAGETLSAEGVLTGGVLTVEAGSSALHRKVQISELETEAEGLRSQLAEATATRDTLGENLATSRSRLAEAREETQRMNLALSNLRGQCSMIEREINDAGSRRNSLENERNNLGARHDEAARRIESIEAAISTGIASLEEIRGGHARSQSELEELRVQEAAMLAELNDLRVKVATERQRRDSLANQRQPMAARLHELADLIEQRRRDIASYDERAARLTEENNRISEEIEGARVQAGEAEQSVSALMAERGGIVSDIEHQDAELRILRRQFSECQEQRGQQEVRQTQLQLRIDNVCEHIQRRYQIDLREFTPDSYALFTTIRDVKKRQRNKVEAVANGEGEAAAAAEAETPEAEAKEAAQQQPEEGIDWSEVERLAGELGQRLDSMGPINVDAIQEYDELEQRHTFLEQQLTDLANSKAELLNVIAKINTTTRQLFADTFEQVRVNFQEMFRELFGEGGKANLVLVDESDPLESGIDIIAKPPGKQLQSISLLSGGERTMTAVSLLFAIYMVKPSPFCVLDEMDAPLDESNINRFIKILDRFVSQSQFVVITHNKRTIAKADVIYGVTMEEHGVSKLVGVRFAKREESSENNDIIGTANPGAVPSVAESFGKGGDLASEAKAG